LRSLSGLYDTTTIQQIENTPSTVVPTSANIRKVHFIYATLYLGKTALRWFRHVAIGHEYAFLKTPNVVTAASSHARNDSQCSAGAKQHQTS
jgi:hypothetical protein